MKRTIAAVSLIVILGTTLFAAAQETTVPDASCLGGFTSQINGEYVDIFCFTAVPTATATGTSVPATVTATSTATHTPTATNTAVPPTATPTITMTYLPTVMNTVTSTQTPTATGTPLPPTATNTAVPPTVTNTPIPATGIGVIGDSGSDPYRPLNRGGADSFAWTEIVRDWRGINFGPSDSYIAAASGNTTAYIDDQIAVLADPIQAGHIWRVVEFIGANDLYQLCNTHYSTTAYNNLRNTMLTNFRNGFIDLINLGMPGNSIYVVTQAERNALQSCSNYVQYNQLVAELNAGLTAQSNQYGFNLIDVSLAFTELSGYIINGNGDIRVNGHTVYNQYCNLPTCLFVSDGHSNTALNGITVNALFANALGIVHLSDSEIAQAAGLE